MTFASGSSKCPLKRGMSAEPHDSNLGVHFPGVRSGFKIPYTSASEEGQVWVRRVNHGPQVRRDGVADNSIFIVFHGAKTN